MNWQNHKNQLFAFYAQQLSYLTGGQIQKFLQSHLPAEKFFPMFGWLSSAQNSLLASLVVCHLLLHQAHEQGQLTENQCEKLLAQQTALLCQGSVRLCLPTTLAKSLAVVADDLYSRQIFSQADRSLCKQLLGDTEKKSGVAIGVDSDATMAVDTSDITLIADATPSSDITIVADSEATDTTASSDNTFVMDSEAPASDITIVADSEATDTAVMPGHGGATGSSKEKLGPYELIKELGAGGMGKVYKAYHPQLGRTVAIKVMLRGAEIAPKERERFLSEARLTAKLRHPNIVAVHDIGQVDNKDYIVMDFLDGEPLAVVMKKSRLPLRNSLEIVRDVALALAYAHRQGIVHRDIKPANIMLEKNGKPVVMDFGLAKNIRLESGVTKSGEILGTPRYMSPEQAGGRTSEISPRTDVYALGAMLYEMITGVTAVPGDTPFNIIYNILHQEVVPPRQRNPRLASDLETICLKAMAKEAKDRYSGGQDLADDLDRFLNGEAILARPGSLGYRAWKKIKRHKLAVVGLVAALLAYLAWGWHSERRQLQHTLHAAGELERQTVDDSNQERFHNMSVLLQSLWRQKAQPAIADKIYVIEQKIAGWALAKENYGLALSVLDNANKFGPPDDISNRLQTVQQRMWQEPERLLQEAEKNLRAGREFEQTSQKSVGKQRITACSNALEQYSLANSHNEKALVQLNPVLKNLASFLPNGTVKTSIDQGGLLKKNAESIAYEIHKAIGNLALADEDYLLAQVTFARCASLDKEKAQRERIQELIPQRQQLVREQSTALLRDTLTALRQAPQIGELDDHVTAVVNRPRSSVVEEIISYLATLHYKNMPLNVWQRMALTEALGRCGDTDTVSPTSKHNSLTCLLKRLEEVDADRYPAEAEAIIWALYRLRAGITDDRPKELAYALRERMRTNKKAPEFLERTAFAYRNLPLSHPDAAAIKKWDARQHCLRGKMLSEEGKTELAIAHFMQAIMNPQTDQQTTMIKVEAHHGRALAMLTRNNDGLAVSEYTSAIMLNPDYAPSYQLRGRACQKMNRLAEAIQDYDHAVRIDPSLAEAYHDRAGIQVARNELDKAIQDYSEAIRLEPRQTEFYLGRGNARERKGDIEGAIVDYTEALRIRSSARLYQCRGQARQLKGDWSGAIADYGEAIRLEPDWHEPYLARSIALAEKTDGAQALADSNEAIALVQQNLPGHPSVLAQAYYTRAVVSHKGGEFAYAVADCTQAIAIRPDFALAYFQRALSREKQQDDDDNAIKDYGEAIRFDPQMAEAYKNRGYVYARKGLSAKAVQDFTRCLQLHPKDKEARKMETYLKKFAKENKQ